MDLLGREPENKAVFPVCNANSSANSITSASVYLMKRDRSMHMCVWLMVSARHCNKQCIAT